MAGPDRAAYTEIFRRVCALRQIPFDTAAVDFVYREYYEGTGIEPRACHPRDIIDHVMDVAHYESAEPQLSEEFLRRACEAYFLVMAGKQMRTARRTLATGARREAL
jgi:hypothetical protein